VRRRYGSVLATQVASLMARPEEDIREGVERSSVFHFPDRRSD